MKMVPALWLIFVCAVALAQMNPSPDWHAPADAAVKQNPLRHRPQLAAGGKKIFKRTCATCHEAGPEQKGPNLSSPAVQSETDGTLFWKISTGNSRTGMPTFSSLPDSQRWQLVLYIRSMVAKPD